MTNIRAREAWRWIPGYEGRYKASSYGRIKSYTVCKKGRIRRPAFIRGYPVITLYKPWKSKLVHLWVLLAFRGPANGLTCNHKNGIKDDNRLSNLEYCTIKENIRHAYRTGLNRGGAGEKNNNSKLSLSDVEEIKAAYKPYIVTGLMLSKKYGVCVETIWRIVNKRSWKHL